MDTCSGVSAHFFRANLSDLTCSIGIESKLCVIKKR